MSRIPDFRVTESRVNKERKERRERIATAILAGLADRLFVSDKQDAYLGNHIRTALTVTDALIEALDEQKSYCNKRFRPL